MNRIIKSFVGSSLILSTSAFAVTECPEKLVSLFAGDAGNVYMFYTDGGSNVIYANDPNLKNLYALGLTALVAKLNIVVRYSDDGVVCSSSLHNNVVGAYLRAQ